MQCFGFALKNGTERENLFLNIAVEVKTILSAQQVLNEITHIEKKIGRTTKTKNGIYNDRVIDIDILFFGSEIIDDENLKIPHPLLTQRIFVLKPLCEIAPSFIHPTLKKNIQELYNTLKSI